MIRGVATRCGTIAALVSVLVLLLTPTSASAHAELLESTPAPSAVLDAAPAEVLLRFSEGVDPIDPAIRIVDAEGREISRGAGDQSAGGDTIALGLDDAVFSDGTYVVAWQAVSADSHNIRGAFTFSIGEESATRTEIFDELFDSDAAQSATIGVLGVGRFASYAGVALLVGGLGVSTTLMRSQVATRRTGRVLALGATLGVAGSAVMVGAQARLIGSSVFDVEAVAATASGQWWVLRLALVGLVASLIPFRASLTGTMRTPVVLSALAGVLGIVAAGGHGVTGRYVEVGYATTVIHLCAMALWLGGVAVVVAHAGSGENGWSLANRFSPWALGAVGVLMVSGSVNGWRQIGSIAGVTSSAYGRWLVVKVAIVAVVIAVAAVSRAAARRGPTHSSASLSLSAAFDDDTRSDANASTMLRRTVTLEAFGAVLILAATAGLVNATPPDRDVAQNVLASTVVDDRVAQVELEPARTGGTVMHVTIVSPRGGLDRADEITVLIELPSAQVGPLEIETIPVGPNHVVANDADFPVGGDWNVEITARYGEFDQVVFTVDVAVSD